MGADKAPFELANLDESPTSYRFHMKTEKTSAQLAQRDSMQAFSKIAFLGYPGPIMLAFVRACAKEGISTYLVQVAKESMPIGKYSRWLDGVTNIDPEIIGSENGINFIEQTIRDIGADGLIAVDEIHLRWLVDNGNVLRRSVRLLMPTRDCLYDVSSKKRQIAIAADAGFDILPTDYIYRTSDSDEIADSNFPICLRPSDPTMVSPCFKARIFQTRTNVSTFLEGLNAIQSPIIAQPFHNFPDLKVHGSRSEDGQILAMEPFFVERKFEGVTLTLMRGSFPSGVRDCCEKFAHLAGLTGGFHFDLLYSTMENRAYFLEVNARMGGITDKAMAFGYNQPRLILRSYGHPVTTTDTSATSRKRVVTKRAVIKHITKAVTGRLTELDYPAVNLVQHVALSIRDLLFACDSVFDRHDIVGSIWFNFQWSAGFVLKLKHRLKFEEPVRER